MSIFIDTAKADSATTVTTITKGSDIAVWLDNVRENAFSIFSSILMIVAVVFGALLVIKCIREFANKKLANAFIYLGLAVLAFGVAIMFGANAFENAGQMIGSGDFITNLGK